MAVKRGSSMNSKADGMLLCIIFQAPVAACAGTFSSVMGSGIAMTFRATTHSRPGLDVLLLEGTAT